MDNYKQIQEAYDQINEATTSDVDPTTFIKWVNDMKNIDTKKFIKLYDKHTGTADPDDIKDVKLDAFQFMPKTIIARLSSKVLDYDGRWMSGFWFVTFDGKKIISVDV